jgi:N,N'-diacetyllegionaminate synthase
MTGPEVFIIAEAGVNHNGSLETALEMVDVAKWAGVDAIKFQTWKTENVVTKTSPKAAYQKMKDDTTSQFDLLKKLELPYEAFITLKDYCQKIGLEFMSTADEFESARFLAPLQQRIKVGSAELTDWPFLKKIAHFGKPVIISTGMGTLQEVGEALDILIHAGLAKSDITVLHANTEYPTPFCDVNLLAMKNIGEIFGVAFGYSDHTVGIEVPIAAVALGASVIEKHFTLNRAMDGPDHAASLEPGELKAMVEGIRNIQCALGDGVKKPSASELKNMPVARKSIVAKIPILRGETFTDKNITVKRPGFGLSPTRWDEVLGKKAKRNFAIDEHIEI